METARVVLDFVKTLAWPAVVTVLAFLFRESLGDVLRRLTELSGLGLSAKLADQVQKQADKANELPPVSNAADGPDEASSSHAEATSFPRPNETRRANAVAKTLARLAQDDPATAIRASWVMLSHEPERIALRFNLSAQSPQEALSELGASDQVLDLFRGQERIYREIKDAKARHENVSSDTAETYLSVTKTLRRQLSALENARAHLESKGEAIAQPQPNGAATS